MAACPRCATQVRPTATVCLGCGLVLGTAAPMTSPAPATPNVPAPVAPPVDNPWRTGSEAEHRTIGTPPATATARYGVPQPVQRPAEPIMPPNPFAKGAQTDRGPLPPQLPVRHESASIPVAFAQFSEPAPVTVDAAGAVDDAEVVVLHRPSLTEALQAALADLPEDAPDHHEEAPEPFPQVLSVAPPAVNAPGWGQTGTAGH